MTNQLKQENVKDSFYIKKCMAREYKVKVKETSLYLPVFVICTMYIYVGVSFYHLFKFLVSAFVVWSCIKRS